MIAEDVHPQMAEIIWHSLQVDQRKDLLINIAFPSPPLGAKLLNMTPLSDLSQGRKHSRSKNMSTRRLVVPHLHIFESIVTLTWATDTMTGSPCSSRDMLLSVSSSSSISGSSPFSPATISTWGMRVLFRAAKVAKLNASRTFPSSFRTRASM